jgi:hypothetical protein
MVFIAHNVVVRYLGKIPFEKQQLELLYESPLVRRVIRLFFAQLFPKHEKYTRDFSCIKFRVRNV